MGITSTSTNLFNTVNDGEAPQLSSTYAEYDDGFNVFNHIHGLVVHRYQQVGVHLVQIIV